MANCEKILCVHGVGGLERQKYYDIDSDQYFC